MGVAEGAGVDGVAGVVLLAAVCDGAVCDGADATGSGLEGEVPHPAMKTGARRTIKDERYFMRSHGPVLSGV